jgi:type IV secretory pathway VirD2 relaxase
MAMAVEPQRREKRRTHLDVSVVPVERALLARAEAMARTSGDETASDIECALALAVAGEFVALAEELHW